MKEKIDFRSKKAGIAFVALLIFAVVCVMPAAAVELPDYQHLYVTPANGVVNETIDGLMQDDESYLIDWTNSTGGLNAVHISGSASNLYGEVLTPTTNSGSFYITDTGGRKYQDNYVLMVAVNSSDYSNIQLSITSSGYKWMTTGNGIAPPESATTHVDSAISDTFTSSDYTEVSSTDVFQIWKPGPTDVFPIYNGQTLSNSETFKLMFIDLDVGTFYNVSTRSSLTDYGNVKVDYTISGLSSGSKVAFNAYAWNNLTSYPYTQAIRWTNSVSEDDEDSGISGLLVTIPNSK